MAGGSAADEVAITAGCNQAFCSVVATLAAPGDEVILPTPWYFNHKMWLDMSGMRTVPLSQGAGLTARSGGGGGARHAADAGDGARVAQQSGRGGVSRRSWCARSGRWRGRRGSR